MKCSFHRDVVGKPIRDEQGKLWCGTKQINLGYNWITGHFDLDEIFMMLTEGGAAIAPALSSDHRVYINFESCQLALVDIDSGMKLWELEDHWFYQLYGAGFYTTASHTEDNHRFRILYVLEDPITDREMMRHIYEGLLAIHGAADTSCKDVCRLFYGVTSSEYAAIQDKRIDQAGIETILSQRPPSHKPDMAPLPDKAPSAGELTELLNDLKNAFPILHYRERFIVVNTLGTYMTKEQAILQCRIRWSDAQSTGKYEGMLTNHGKYVNTPRIGTLIHMMRSVQPNYRKPTNHTLMKNQIRKLLGMT